MKHGSVAALENAGTYCWQTSTWHLQFLETSNSLFAIIIRRLLAETRVLGPGEWSCVMRVLVGLTLTLIIKENMYETIKRARCHCAALAENELCENWKRKRNRRTEMSRYSLFFLDRMGKLWEFPVRGSPRLYVDFFLVMIESVRSNRNTFYFYNKFFIISKISS